MLRRKLFAVLVTLTLVFTLTPLSAFAEEVMDGTSPPAQLEAAEQTGELLIGEEQGVDEESGTDKGTATEEVSEEVPGEKVPEEEDGNDDSGETIPDAAEQYSVIIHYFDENGNALHDDFVGLYAPGSAFDIPSPIIEGYIPDFARITSEEGGMPKESQEYTVTYSRAVPVAGAILPADAKADKAAPKAVAAAAVTAADTRSYELTVIGEEKTPLAGGFLDADCCVLHLLLMLLATAVLIWYTKDMKQHQKRILELEDQLDLH